MRHTKNERGNIAIIVVVVVILLLLVLSPLLLLLFLGGVHQTQSVYMLSMDSKYLQESYETAERLHEAHERDRKRDREDRKGIIEIEFVDILAYAMLNSEDWEKFDDDNIDDLYKNAKKGIDVIDYQDESFKSLRSVFDNALGSFVGDYEVMEIETRYNDDGGKRKVVKWEDEWGLRVYYPYPDGFRYTHNNDFGAGRTYGGNRSHLGNDIMAKMGVPIVAVEKGRVENIGWNELGGWRVGIRSSDGRKYYYYAHMERYADGLSKGDSINAGEVIGYCGDSGYGSVGTTGKFATHLHIQIRVDYDTGNGKKESVWINPYPVLSFIDKKKDKATVDEDEDDDDDYKGTKEIDY